MDDVIVVGGRCAGAPTAMLLARAGFKVRIIERASRLGDTVSGHVVKTAGTARLRAWGLLDAVLATGCPPITDIMVWVDGQLAETSPVGTPDVPIIAPRRGALDPVLLEAARRAGAIVEMGTPVCGLLRDGTRVTGVSTDRGDFRARLVVGADGRNSRIARLVGAGKYIDCVPATYQYQTYWKGSAVTQMNVFFCAECLIGMLPTNDDRAMVFIQAARAGFGAARRDATGNYLAILAGDAGHHKDPLIGRGITDAFRDAELIAAAAVDGWDGDLDQAIAAYPARRDACARPARTRT